MRDKYIETLHYAQDLESQIRIQSKELQRLQYLTQFMILNQRKREEMIGHLFEENRKLKAALNQQILFKDPPHKLLQTPTIRPLSASKDNSKDAKRKVSHTHKISQDSTSLNNNSNIIINNNNEIMQIHKKSILKSQNKTYKVFEESISHQNILNMNISSKAEKLLYEDNQYVTALSPILEEQDIFIDYVSNNNMNALITLYDHMTGLFNEHKSLHFLIYRLKKIIKAANVMTSSLILAEAIERIVDETIEFLDCDRATVFILDEKKEELWSKVAKGSDFTIKIPMNKGIVGHVVMTGKSVNIIDAYSDERFNKQVDIKSNYKTKTILCSPITDMSNRVTGAIQAINKLKGGAFSKDDEGLLEILANIAGVILRNSLHYDETLLFQNNLRHILKNGVLLNSFFSYEKLVPHAEKVLKNIMNVDLSVIYLLNRQENLLVHFTDTGHVFYEANSGIAGYTIQKKDIESISNAYAHPLFNGQVDLDTTLPIICIPIIQPEGHEVMGVFEVLNPKGLQTSIIKQKSKISGVEYEILQFFRLQLGQIISNMQEWEKVKGSNMLAKERTEEKH